MRIFLTLVVLLVAGLTPEVAEAGCRCGNSYISEYKTCHKCPCECPSCDYRDCAAPETPLYTPVPATRYTPIAGPITITIQDPVIFNKQSRVYHKESCPSAQSCSRNCAWTERADAIKRGGRPCQRCGG